MTAPSPDGGSEVPASTPSGPRADADGPLAGIRVLDVAQVVMEPFAAQVLADQGCATIWVVRHPDVQGGAL